MSLSEQEIKEIKDQMLEKVLALDSYVNACKLLLTGTETFHSNRFARCLSEMDKLRTELNLLYCKIM